MTKYIILNSGAKIHYTDCGNDAGNTVLLMHGWGCDHTTVSSIERILTPYMRVLNVDLPGFGESPEPIETWGVDEYTESMEEFLDKLHVKNPILIGHSFGGRICLLMGSRREIHKIVLVDAAGVKPRRSLKWYVKVYSYKLLKKLYPLLVGKKRATELINKARKRRSSADYENASLRMRSILSKCVNEDLCSVMPMITAPTLLIWGAEDTATPLSDARKIEKLIPDAGLVSFEGCGHYSFLDNPKGFRAVLSSFLNEDMQHNQQNKA